MSRAIPTSLVIILGSLTAFGPMSIDMYLPSFPQLAASLQAPSGQVQYTLAVFFIGLALGQIAYGPVSDRFGRKPPLYVGIVIYIAASVGCALTTSVESLIAWRFLQALGGCAGIILARAMVRDLFDHHTAAKVFSALMLVMGVAPILAPLLGGWVLTVWGWRGIFWVLAGFGVACLLAVRLGLPESRPADASHQLRILPILKVYGALLKDREYLGYALATGTSMAGMFAYITGSPFVFIELYHVPASAFGWLFGLNAFGLIVFSQLNARLINRISPDRLLRIVLPVQTLCGLALLACALTGAGGLVALMFPLFGFVASLGFINPNGTAGALRHQARHAGSAAALLGCFQFGVATLSGSAVGALQDGTARPMALVMACAGVLALTFYWFLVPRRTTVSSQS